ncbi:MAG: Diguanylate phosphodiesterase [Desulfotomaculum sp. 46_80]|nr:MAG: Diguanylate phosphodiesterase [Desulfotomaculum sp. 46_80]HAU32728.1 diguanylate phosphodiesterase [Desulfotomaculum sp.]
MEVLLARQPIFDNNQNVFAYELLYRSGAGNYYDCDDGDRATLEVITSSLLLIGFEKLTRGKRAFINFTKNLLEGEVATYLPKDTAVIEIENIDPDAKTIQACRRLKSMGFVLTLDDFLCSEKYEPLIELVDFIKVDFLNTDFSSRKNIIKTIGKHKKFLAEKVETYDEYTQAQEMGYTYFQGYFFSKPVIIRGKDIPTYKMNYFQLLKTINQPVFDLESTERLVRNDVALSYKLLRFINSGVFYLKSEIRSIKHALTLLGKKGTVKWVSLIALKMIGEDKPNELIITTLGRATFCELLSEKVGFKNRSSDFFLMGMFSLIDAFLDQPLENILLDLPICEEIKEALLGNDSPFKDPYNLMIAYEKGDWECFHNLAGKLNLNEKEVMDFYVNSLDMANKIFF